MRTWTVADVMSTDVVTIRSDTPYREIVDVLAERLVSAAPVVDADHRVVGVVSEADLLHKIELIGEEHQRRIFAGPRRRKAQIKALGAVARDLMSAPAIMVAADTSLISAAKLMEDKQVKRLPVVERAGKPGAEPGRLVGIVSRGDLLRVYLRPDRQIAHDLDEVLHRTLWVEPKVVSVTVQDGVVTLAGRTDRYSTARLAVKLAQGVPGVVEVVDRLGFSFDDRKLAEAHRFGGVP